MMFNRITPLAVSATFISAVILWAQNPNAKEILRQRVAELKQSIAANKAKQQKYYWTETTQISLKGEVKKEVQKICRFGPDGQVQKTPILDPSASAPKEKRGLRGKIVEKKVGELQDYMERVGSLVRWYVPPNPQKIQACVQAGHANLNLSSGGPASLTLTDYYKAGDQITFNFDRTEKRLESYVVNSYLDTPGDAVDVTAQFSSLPDGTNYVAQSVLNASAKKIQVTTTNSNYTLVGH